jgi:hypothetical protein
MESFERDQIVDVNHGIDLVHPLPAENPPQKGFGADPR